jgi:uncharacterized protein (TIGR03437 family)
MKSKSWSMGWISLVMCAVPLGAQTGNWTQQNPQDSPTARGTPRMAYDSMHSQVVLFGGGNGNPVNQGYLDDTWIWDGTNWTQSQPAQSPTPRSNTSIAYDSALGQTVIFGGEGLRGARLGDTWLWDGTNWTQLQELRPPAREYHAMTFDSQHGQVVMFGGEDVNGELLNDTWLFDGTSWTLARPQSSPPARAGLAMAYDSTHGQVVLFGGTTNQSNFADTWLWDGTNWTQATPQNSPPARCYHEMAYDSVHDQVVLFGGGTSYSLAENSGLLNDTWLWDGSNWTEAQPQNSPPARNRFGMTFDAGHAQAVVFSGRTATGGFLPDTWTWSVAAVVTPPPPVIPVIAASNGVVNGASFQPGISPDAWLTISGTNLSAKNDTWDGLIVNGALPTSIDGVSVMVGDQAAYVEYVSSTQINAIAPDVAAGNVAITVTNAQGTSQSVTAELSNETPAFFQWGNFAVATHQDFSYAVKNGTFSGVTTVPAKPGDVIILWATGFGPTSPAAPPGEETPSTATYNTASPVSVTVGGKSATVYGAALAPGYAGLYQIAIQVPAGLANGDYPVVATINRVSSPASTMLTVDQP